MNENFYTNPNYNPNMPVMTSSDDDDDAEIDVGEIFGLLWHWMWLILLVGFLCGVAGYCFSRFVLPEQFESTTEIYVLNRNDATQSSSTTYSDLQVSSQLTADYQELIKSRYVLERVIDELGLEDEGYDYDTLSDNIKVSSPTDTHIVSVTVTDTDPERAQRICNAVREVASEHIKNVMNIDAVNVVDEANLPTEKSAPSNSRWALIAALVGALLVCVVLIVRYIMDDSIKTSDDVEKYLGLSVLALIPEDEVIAENSDSGAKTKKKKKKKKNDGEKRSSHGFDRAKMQAPETPAAPADPEERQREKRQEERRAQDAARRHRREEAEAAETERKRENPSAAAQSGVNPEEKRNGSSASGGKKNGKKKKQEEEYGRSTGSYPQQPAAGSDMDDLGDEGTGYTYSDDFINIE